MKKWTGWIVLTLGIQLISLSACQPAGAVQITNIWARPALAGNNSAVYFQIYNNTQSVDILNRADSEIAASVELHQSSLVDGVMKMEPQNSVEVPAGSTIEFKPGGFHIMLVNLKKDLKVGDSFTLTLQFQKLGPQTLQVTVKDQ